MVEDADKQLEKDGRPFPYNEIPRVEVQFELEDKIMAILNEAGLGRIVFCHNDWWVYSPIKKNGH